MRSHYLALSALLVLAPALAAQAHDFAPYLIADRAEEVALARSAAPATISGAATIYVMTDTGFAEAAKGSNGFTCLVIRSFLMPGADSATTWEPRLRAPHCYNATAARTIVPNVLYRAHAVFRGVSPARVEAGVRSAYASHRWPLTGAGAIAYMLSPGQWLGPNDPHWKPHMMFFLPAGHPASTWGADKSTDAPVIDAGSYPFASPGGFILIPVERWSDGTPFVAAVTDAHQH